MNLHIAYKTITVILDKDGTATEIAKKLKKDHSLLTGNIQNARGTGDPSSKRNFLNQLEKDLFTVVVPGSQFGGFMYQAHLSQLSEFTLPNLNEQ